MMFSERLRLHRAYFSNCWEASNDTDRHFILLWVKRVPERPMRIWLKTVPR